MKRTALVLFPLALTLLGACADTVPTGPHAGEMTVRMDEEACPGGGMVGSNGKCTPPAP